MTGKKKQTLSEKEERFYFLEAEKKKTEITSIICTVIGIVVSVKLTYNSPVPVILPSCIVFFVGAVIWLWAPFFAEEKWAQYESEKERLKQ